MVSNAHMELTDTCVIYSTFTLILYILALEAKSTGARWAYWRWLMHLTLYEYVMS